MPNFFQCMDYDNQSLWIDLMSEYGCKFNPPRQKPINLEVNFEPKEDVEKLMQIIPGFDRGED